MNSTKSFKPPFRQPAPDAEPITITVHRITPRGEEIRQSVRIEGELAMSFKSIVDDACDRVGGQLMTPMAYPREEALTKAAAALNAFRALVNTVVKAGNPNFK